MDAWGVESHENWDAVQDATGRVFVANGRGVLVHDGAVWKVVQTPRVTAVRSLAVGPGGRVFAGAQGEFGYLEPDTSSYRFVPLSALIPDEDTGFGNVWTTRADGDHVFFQAPKHLFVWDGNELVTVRADSSYHTSFLTSRGLVLRERGVGLVRYAEGRTEMIPGGEFFANMRVFVLEEQGSDWLIGTRDNGFFKFRDGVATPFPTQADPLLSEYWLYTNARGEGGDLVLGTLGAGILVMDRTGRVTSRITAETGLPDAHITSITPIRPSGFLATTQNNGVYFFQSPGVTTRWGFLSLGAVNNVYVHGDSLMVSSGAGLETTPLDRPAAPTRLLVDRLVYLVRAVGNRVYMGTDEGVQVWAGGRAVATLLEDEQVMALAPYGNGVVAGFRDGVAIIEGTTEVRRWTATEVVSIATAGEEIWYSTLSDGLHRYGRDSSGDWVVRTFGKADGLPANDRLQVVNVGGTIRAYADDSEGVYKLAAGFFMRDEELTPLDRGGEQEVWSLVEGGDGTVWVGYSDRIEKATPSPRGYVLTYTSALTFQRQRQELLFAARDGTLWFNRGGSVVRYDPRLDNFDETDFDVILREVRSRRNHALIFGGTEWTGDAVVTRPSESPELEHAQNALTILFASAYPAGMDNVQYSWRLLPDQTEWTPWSTWREAALEDLREGAYTFQVRARDHRLREARPAEFAFSVAPPWYRAWWAYLTYVALSLAFVWFVYRYQVMVRAQKASEVQARELEREKVYRQKLEVANTRLIEANKLKDGFIEKVSHELRTPITAILGFTGILQDEIPEDESYREFLDIIQESGDRLMITLDDLLELAKLRAGSRAVTPEPVNVETLMGEIASRMRGRAGEKGIYLRVKSDAPGIVSIDVQALTRILHNLIDNAVKFTEQGGVNVHVSLVSTCSCDPHAEGCLQVVVRDTGIGINERFLPHLFDEFQQESGGESRTHNGTGLGLTIVGGLVELLGGRVEVASEKDVGSTFTVRLPMAKIEVVSGAVLGEDRPAVDPLARRSSAFSAPCCSAPKDGTDRPAERRERDRPQPGPGETA